MIIWHSLSLNLLALSMQTYTHYTFRPVLNSRVSYFLKECFLSTNSDKLVTLRVTMDSCGWREEPFLHQFW
jgi:hypothetical protein